MSLRGKKIPSRWFENFFHRLELPTLLEPEESTNLVKLLIAGKLEARNKLIEHHLRLILQIVGKYVTYYNSDKLAEEMLGAALYAATNVTERVRLGQKEMYDDNISAIIVEAVHSEISRTLERRHLIHIPGSTKRQALLDGKEPIKNPVFSSLNHTETTGYSKWYDEEERTVSRQGWWKGCRPRKLISESEIRECLDKVIQSPLERKIVELRTTYIDGKPMSDRHIADELEVSYGTVNIIRHDIADRLKKELQ